MIWVFILALIAIVVGLELYTSKHCIENIAVKYDIDMTLVEPGERITMSYVVQNNSRLPILFVNYAFQMPEDAEILEDEKWQSRYVDKGYAGTTVNVHLFLFPAHRYTGKIHFCFSKRGLREIGKQYVEVGDFLGLKSEVRSMNPNKNIVCTAKAYSDELVYKTLGGFIGEVSVRRFIYEDPNIIAGYHEYTGREPLNRISWNMSAKSGSLMVKQNDFTVDMNVAIVVNMDGGSARERERCLEITRTVAEALEAAKIPYSFLSNGDLLSLPEGLGKTHLHTILRKIGLSRLGSHTGFGDLIEHCLRDKKNNRSFILITPPLPEEDEIILDRLRRYADHEVSVLEGKVKEKS